MTTWSPALEAELRYLILLEYRRQQRVDAACRNKHGFHSPQLARESRPRRAMHGHVTVYRCEVCRLWHIGSHLSPLRRNRRAAGADFSHDLA